MKDDVEKEQNTWDKLVERNLRSMQKEPRTD